MTAAPAEMATFINRDVLDTVQLATHLQPGERVLDVGTGGGVPGVLLAIVRPDLEVALAESVGKKAEAVADIVTSIDLPITVYAGRAEHVIENQPFDTLVARAVGPMWKILKWVRPHWNQFQRLLLIKGPKWIEERGQARHRGHLHGLALRKLASYKTPGHDGDSVILSVTEDDADTGEDQESDQAGAGSP